MSFTQIAKPPHGSEQWLMMRHRDEFGRCTLGASDAPPLMNQSPFATRADLFHAKRTRPRVSEPTAAMHFGNIVEPVLVAELGRRLGCEMVTPQTMYRRDKFTVTLDAIGVTNGAPAVIGEVKTTRRHRVSELADVPGEYLWQCWAQMLVLERPVYLIVLDRDMNISHFEIPRNERAAELLSEESRKFCEAVDLESTDYLTSVLDHLNAEQVADLVRPEPKSLEITSEQYAWVRDLAEARDLKRTAEQIEQAARDNIARFMLDNEIATIDGKKVLTWKEQAGRSSVDLARLRQDHPELVAAYTQQGQPSRVMRLSNTKGN